MSNIFQEFSKSNEKNRKDKFLAIKTNRCPQNHPCPSVRVCPVGALSQQGYNAPTVDMGKCIKCGKCANFCPMRALVLELCE